MSFWSSISLNLTGHILAISGTLLLAAVVAHMLLRKVDTTTKPVAHEEKYFQKVVDYEQDMSAYSGKTDEYEWKQNGEEVEITAALPAGTCAKDVQVRCYTRCPVLC